MVRQRVRIRFCKQQDLRLIGHKDLMRCLERLFRRAELPLAMSQGFHPKPRLTFPSALALGIEGADEVMELELTETAPAPRLHEQLRRHVPHGLSIKSVEVLPEGSKKAQVHRVSYRMPVPPKWRDGLSEKIDRLLASSSWPVERPRQATSIDLRPPLEELRLYEGVLSMRLRVDRGKSVRPQEVLEAIGVKDLLTEGVYLTRDVVEIQP